MFSVLISREESIVCNSSLMISLGKSPVIIIYKCVFSNGFILKDWNVWSLISISDISSDNYISTICFWLLFTICSWLLTSFLLPFVFLLSTFFSFVISCTVVCNFVVCGFICDFCLLTFWRIFTVSYLWSSDFECFMKYLISFSSHHVVLHIDC